MKRDAIDIGRSESGTARRGQQARVAEAQGDYRRLNAKQLGQLIARLEQEMHCHAENLEFEQAAQVRGQIHAARESALRGDAVDVGGGWLPHFLARRTVRRVGCADDGGTVSGECHASERA